MSYAGIVARLKSQRPRVAHVLEMHFWAFWLLCNATLLTVSKSSSELTHGTSHNGVYSFTYSSHQIQSHQILPQSSWEEISADLRSLVLHSLVERTIQNKEWIPGPRQLACTSFWVHNTKVTIEFSETEEEMREEEAKERNWENCQSDTQESFRELKLVPTT